MTDLDALLAAVRADLERAARVAGEDPEAFRAVAEELRPFVDAAARCADPRDDAAARELRSVAWLLAYRVGDQGLTGLTLESLLRAWRAHGPLGAEGVLEGVRDLFTDGFARGREDRARQSLLRSLAGAVPLVPLGPKAFMVVVCDPLDASGADAVAERVGASLLREGARSVLVHLHALKDPGLDVLAPLWTLASSARMLGCACVFSGAREELLRALEEGALPREPATHVDDVAEAVRETLARAGAVVGAVPAPLRWILQRRADQ